MAKRIIEVKNVIKMIVIWKEFLLFFKRYDSTVSDISGTAESFDKSRAHVAQREIKEEINCNIPISEIHLTDINFATVSPKGKILNIQVGYTQLPDTFHTDAIIFNDELIDFAILPLAKANNFIAKEGFKEDPLIHQLFEKRYYPIIKSKSQQ